MWPECIYAAVQDMKIIESSLLVNPALPPDTEGITTALLPVSVVVVGGGTVARLLCWFRPDWTTSMKASQPHAQTVY